MYRIVRCVTQLQLGAIQLIGSVHLMDCVIDVLVDSTVLFTLLGNYSTVKLKSKSKCTTIQQSSRSK